MPITSAQMAATQERRYDAMRGTAYPYRLTQRATAAEVERLAADLGLQVMWATARRIGLTTHEVTLAKGVA